MLYNIRYWFELADVNTLSVDFAVWLQVIQISIKKEFYKKMKRLFKKLSILLVFIIAVSASVVVLSGCSSDSTPYDMGDYNAASFGNGSTVVQQGQWLYFVNGFQDRAVLANRNSNRWGTPLKGSIARVRYDEMTNPYNPHYSNPRVEVIVPNIVTLERGFTIMGRYIYFATTCISQDRFGNVRSNDIVFARVRTDGSNRQEITTVSNFIGRAEFGFFRIWDGNNYADYFAYLRGSNLYQIGLRGRERSWSSRRIAENVVSASFNQNHTFDPNFRPTPASVNSNFIYFTQNVTEEELRQNPTQRGQWLRRVQVGQTGSTRIETLKAPIYNLTLELFKEDTLFLTQRGGLEVLQLVARCVNSTSTIVANRAFDWIDVLPGSSFNNLPPQSAGESIVAQRAIVNYVIAGVGSNVYKIDLDRNGLGQVTPVFVGNIAGSPGGTLARMGIGFDSFMSAYYMYYVSASIVEDSNVFRLQLRANASLESVSIYNIKASAPQGFGFFRDFIFGFENILTRQYKFMIRLNTTLEYSGRLIGREHPDDVIETDDD